MSAETLLPAGWPRPSGYSNGVKATGTYIVVAGQVGWDPQGKFAMGMAAQAEQALRNIRAVLEAGGGGPEHLVRLTWYVRDIEEYLADLPALGAAYRAVMGRHYPAMAVVEVTRLVEPAARLEIEATAVLPT